MYLGIEFGIWFMIILLASGEAIFQGRGSKNWHIHEVVKDVLQNSPDTDCSMILISDGDFYSPDLVKVLSQHGRWGMGVFQTLPEDINDFNETQTSMSNIIPIARQLRRASWCAVVIAVSDDVQFLKNFAELSLKQRLLRWVTKLLVVTKIEQQILMDLMTYYWTYSMMNAMFLHYSFASSNSWTVYNHSPYIPNGPKNIKVATWNLQEGFGRFKKLNLFPEKYDNFHGYTIKVTAKPFAPYWIETEYTNPDGSKAVDYAGTDGNLFNIMANKLNFTYNVFAPVTWNVGLEMVARRDSYMTPVYCMVLPNRLKLFEFSYEYEFAFLGFGMRKPSLIPQWQSLYYPLTNGVWLATLGSLVIMPPLLFMITRPSEDDFYKKRLTQAKAVQELLGTLLGQNFTGNLPTGSPGRTLMLAWLLFAFIIGTAYRGNLTASLTSPKYSPRAENLEQLVDAADRATWGSYGKPFKVFFSQSSEEVFRRLADLLVFGPSVKQGLQQALENKRSATVSGLRYMQDIIADKYTRPDGTTDLYIGRENIIPGLSGWPIPHDAPYKANMDWIMMKVLEAGLYDQWSAEFIEKTRLRSAKRQREYLAKQKSKEVDDTKGKSMEGNTITALSLNHMQGPLILFGLGLLLGFIVLVFELSYGKCCSNDV